MEEKIAIVETSMKLISQQCSFLNDEIKRLSETNEELKKRLTIVEEELVECKTKILSKAESVCESVKTISSSVMANLESYSAKHNVAVNVKAKPAARTNFLKDFVQSFMTNPSLWEVSVPDWKTKYSTDEKITEAQAKQCYTDNMKNKEFIKQVKNTFK